MKNVFLAIVQETGGIDRLEMSARHFSAVLVRKRDGLDPMNRVLQNEKLSQAQDQFMRKQRIRWRRSHVEKK